MMNKALILNLLRLSRPINVLITALSIGVAGIIAGIGDNGWQLGLAMISAGLIAAAANTVNDYYDIEIDRINKPERPIASGSIEPSVARSASSLEYLLGTLIAAFISLPALAMAAFFSALTWIYASFFKRQPLSGNAVVSISTAAAFIYGGIAVNNYAETIYPAIFAFFFHFGREIIKDMEDMEGDKAAGARTLPLVHGTGAAKQLIWINFLLLTIATLFPWYQGEYGPIYMWIVLIGVYPVLTYCLYVLQGEPTPKQLNFLSNLLKADMLVGLLAVYLR
ncbi:MAG: geranylgeranylglycerol-phosphate geranylgeranyltransferase [Calditrichota bacterium]